MEATERREWMRERRRDFNQDQNFISDYGEHSSNYYEEHGDSNDEAHGDNYHEERQYSDCEEYGDNYREKYGSNDCEEYGDNYHEERGSNDCEEYGDNYHEERGGNNFEEYGDSGYKEHEDSYMQNDDKNSIGSELTSDYNSEIPTSSLTSAGNLRKQENKLWKNKSRINKLRKQKIENKKLRRIAVTCSQEQAKAQLLDGNAIFYIISKRPNFQTCLMTYPKTIFDLKIPDTNESDQYNYWNTLSAFLYDFVTEVPGEYLLRKSNKKLIMEMRVPEGIRPAITKLIEQYGGRNNLERFYMHLNCDRNLNRLKTLLTDKINELYTMNLSKNIFDLHDELVYLKSIENNQLEGSEKIEKNKKLIKCEKLLLAALYREGCANNSLEKLKKIMNTKKMQEQHAHLKKRKKTLNKRTYELELKVDTNTLLRCLFHYNNVFAPHEPHRLNVFIYAYKQKLMNHEDLKNNSFISNVDNNSTDNEVIENTCDEQYSSSSTSCKKPRLLFATPSSVPQIQPSVSQIGPSVSHTHSKRHQMQRAVSHERPMRYQTRPTSSHMHPTRYQSQSAVPKIKPATSSSAYRHSLPNSRSTSNNFHFSKNSSAVVNNAKINYSREKKQYPTNYGSF